MTGFGQVFGENAGMTPCPNCQNANPPGSTVCVTCGFPLAQTAPDAPPAQQPPPFQPQQQAPQPQQAPPFQPQPQQAPQQQAPSAAPWEQNAPPPFMSGAMAAAAAPESGPAPQAQPTPVYTLPTDVSGAPPGQPETPWKPGSIPEYKPQEAGTAIPDDVKIGGFAEDVPPDSRTTKILIGAVVLLLVGAFLTFQGMPAKEKRSDVAESTTAADGGATAQCRTTGEADGETCVVGLPTVTFTPPRGWSAAPATLEGDGSGATFTAPDDAQAISVVGGTSADIAVPFAAEPRTESVATGGGTAYRTTRPGSTLPVYVVEGANGSVVVEMLKAPNQNGSDPVAVKNFDAVVASLSKAP
jgi:hypothetical protein